VRPKGLQQEGDVVVQRYTQLFNALSHVFPADPAGKGLVLKLFLDAGDFQVLQTAGRPYQRTGTPQ
jgi:hypothetical protein